MTASTVPGFTNRQLWMVLGSLMLFYRGDAEWFQYRDHAESLIAYHDDYQWSGTAEQLGEIAWDQFVLERRQPEYELMEWVTPVLTISLFSLF